MHVSEEELQTIAILSHYCMNYVNQLVLVNPVNARCSKLVLFEGFRAIL